MSEHVIGHSEFTAYPAPINFAHLAAQTQARREGSNRKCRHGYWLHQHQPCPGCFGITPGVNGDVVPHVGEGNGWMLRKGDPACEGCGGPARAGYGLLPPGMTHEQYLKQAPPKRCYGCNVRSPEPLKPGALPGWEHVLNSPAVKALNPGPEFTLPPPAFNPGKERF